MRRNPSWQGWRRVPFTAAAGFHYQSGLAPDKHRSMGEPLLQLRQATESHVDVIIRLIEEAADWLRGMGTDQWAEPWPSEEDRRNRIVRALAAGRTWIVWDGDLPVATLTAEPRDNQHDGRVWPEEAEHDPAVYVCRLVVSRGHSGRGLGAGLLDWAGLTARYAHNAMWIRVDVWTTNKALHAYYLKQGFDFYGYSGKADDYPSAALFQKATDGIAQPDVLLFKELPGHG
jgi:GNAT superfamily N-acetyltransferase